MAQIKFSKESFACLDLPDLLLNIWSNATDLKNPILNQYTIWCTELAGEQWDGDEYLDYKTVMTHLLSGNKNFYDFGTIASCDKKLFIS